MDDFNFFRPRVDSDFDRPQFLFAEENLSRIDDLEQEWTTQAQCSDVDVFATRRAEPGTWLGKTRYSYTWLDDRQPRVRSFRQRVVLSIHTNLLSLRGEVAK